MAFCHAEDQELYETLLAKSRLTGQPIWYGNQTFGDCSNKLQQALLQMAIEFDRNRTRYPHIYEAHQQDQSV
jgi:hypothetical protein